MLYGDGDLKYSEHSDTMATMTQANEQNTLFTTKGLLITKAANYGH